MSGVKQVLKDVLFGERQQRYTPVGTAGTTGITTPPPTPTTLTTTNIPIAEPMNLGGEQVKTDVEVLRRPPVVREVIHPLEKHEVSPVIYREREKTEIRQVEQPIYETIQKPTVVREASLPAETRPIVQAQTGEFDLKYKEGIQNYPQPSVSYAPIEREVITKPPVVIETVRKHVKEEIQPVIYREVLQQEVIRETKPIYEKIVEAPSLIRVQAQPLYETRGLQENLPQITTTGYPSAPTTTMGGGGTIPVSGTTPVSGTYYMQGGYTPGGVGTTTTTMLPGGGLRETKVTLTEAQRGSSSHWNTSSS